MDLALVTSEHQGVPVLSVVGEVDLATIPEVPRCPRAPRRGAPGAAVVVDLDGVGVLDDTGLGVLLGGQRRLRAGGGELHVVASARRIVELLAATRLDTLLPIHATLSQALGVIRGA